MRRTSQDGWQEQDERGRGWRSVMYLPTVEDLMSSSRLRKTDDYDEK